MDSDKQVQWAHGLYEIGQSVAREKSSAVQQRLLDYVVEGFNAKSGSIALQVDKEQLILIAGSGTASPFVGTSMAIGEGVLGWVVQHKEPLLLSGDISSDERFKNLLIKKSNRRPSSSMCWPLMVNQEVFGAMSVNRDPEDTVFSETEFNQSGVMVGLISLVVDNLRLHEAHQKRITSLYELNQELADKQAKLERANAEKMAGEIRLKTILDIAPEAIIVADSQLRITDFNYGAEKIFGYAAEEVIGQPLERLMPERLASNHRYYVKEFMLSEVNQKKMMTRSGIFATRKDGSEFPAGVSISKTLQNGGLLFTAILRDLTQEKEVEQALYDSEDRFRSLVETTGDCVWEVNQDAVYTYVSPRVSELLGYQPHEMVGESIFNFLSADEAKRVADLYGRAIAQQTPLTSLEKVTQHKDGHRTIVMESSGIPFFDDEGCLRGYRGIDRDVTERIKERDTLRDLAEAVSTATGENFFRTLAAYIGRTLEMDYVIISRLLPGNHEVIRSVAVYAKGEVTENFEYALAGTPCEHAIQEKIYYCTSNVQKLFAGCNWLIESQVESYMGKPLIDSTGEVMGIISVLDSKPLKNTESLQSMFQVFSIRAADEMERHQTEEKLRREKDEQETLLRKLQEAQDQLLQSEKMASIGQLAAGVAHEINNPVGYINSNIGSLKSYLDELFRLLDAYEQAEGQLSSVEVKQAIQAIKQEVDLDYLKDDLKNLLNESQEGVVRVKQIVQDLKDFSHVDEVEWQWADLNKGIESTLNIVNNELKYKAEVIKDYGELPQIECIISQLNQVFMNLLVNAAHAIEEQGVITVRTGSKGEGVWVEIQDTGKGMDAETIKKVFDPFFTTKPVGKGTGLGLSLSYGIIQKHSGTITVESEEGQGTRFHIWLPKAQEEQRAAS